jgi:type II secretory pathway pseudopilin PulG
MILSVLVVAALTILNPLTQIKKGQDTQRQHDLKQLQTALDSYYNDNSYYPQSPAALVEVKNIQTVPNDPVASSAWPNYGYVKDINNNPQWDVLFAKLAFPSSSSLSCPLEKMQSCLPENYRDLGYNYCVISGDVECERIVSMTVTPLPIYTPSIINTPTPTQEVTPSPPPFVCYCRDATYFYDPTKEINHQCGVVATTSDPNLNRDFYCSPPVGGLGPCINPCTQ